ncbi:MAG: hypothetical protein AAGA23_23595 [Pseudomonadota bacterium]
MQRAAIERRIRYLQREMVRAAMSTDHEREFRSQALIRALAVERSHLKREMSA